MVSPGHTTASQSGQQGAALIVALLISALVTVIGVRIGNDYQLSSRRASNVMFSDQAVLFLISAENIARQLLLQDPDASVDHVGEPWGMEYPPVPIGNGMLAPQPMIDLQGKFNLNSLYLPGTAGQPGQTRQPSAGAAGANRFTASQKMFIRLLLTFPDSDLDVQQAQDITDAVTDWIDPDDSPRGFESAEDPYYAQLDTPYRTPGSPMRSVSELRLIKGMSAELYRLLAPHVTVLESTVTGINFNTATPVVLQALGSNGQNQLQPLDAQEVEQYLENIDPAVGQQTQDFLKTSPWSSPSKIPNELLSATSNYYAITTLAKMGELTVPMRSVLYYDRSAGKVEVLSRSTGSL